MSFQGMFSQFPPELVNYFAKAYCASFKNVWEPWFDLNFRVTCSAFRRGVDEFYRDLLIKKLVINLDAGKDDNATAAANETLAGLSCLPGLHFRFDRLRCHHEHHRDAAQTSCPNDDIAVFSKTVPKGDPLVATLQTVMSGLPAQVQNCLGSHRRLLFLVHGIHIASDLAPLDLKCVCEKVGKQKGKSIKFCLTFKWRPWVSMFLDEQRAIAFEHMKFAALTKQFNECFRILEALAESKSISAEEVEELREQGEMRESVMRRPRTRRNVAPELANFRDVDDAQQPMIRQERAQRVARNRREELVALKKRWINPETGPWLYAPMIRSNIELTDDFGLYKIATAEERLWPGRPAAWENYWDPNGWDRLSTLFWQGPPTPPFRPQPSLVARRKNTPEIYRGALDGSSSLHHLARNRILAIKREYVDFSDKALDMFGSFQALHVEDEYDYIRLAWWFGGPHIEEEDDDDEEEEDGGSESDYDANHVAGNNASFGAEDPDMTDSENDESWQNETSPSTLPGRAHCFIRTTLCKLQITKKLTNPEVAEWRRILRTSDPSSLVFICNPWIVGWQSSEGIVVAEDWHPIMGCIRLVLAAHKEWAPDRTLEDIVALVNGDIKDSAPPLKTPFADYTISF